MTIFFIKILFEIITGKLTSINLNKYYINLNIITISFKNLLYIHFSHFLSIYKGLKRQNPP